METLGTRLKAIRTQWQLSLKEVEERSAELAQRWGRSSYRISASWLHRIEREDRDPAAVKLIVLAAIYNLSPDDLLSLYLESGGASAMLETASTPNSTVLLMPGPVQDHAKQWLPDNFLSDNPAESTTLLPITPGTMPAHYRRAVIGLDDHTLSPMILAGSYLIVDTTKRNIAGRRSWTNDFDRPIYFLLARTGYFSGFCELDREGEWLTLVPHPLSFAATKRWRYQKEVEVIGTVEAYSMRRPS